MMIDTVDKLKAKMEMVQSLGDIEIATRIIKESAGLNEHPADAHYHKLKNELTPLDPTDPTVKLVEEYVRTTMGKTHTQYDLEVEQVFETNVRCARPGLLCPSPCCLTAACALAARRRGREVRARG